MAADRIRYPSIEARIRMYRSSKAAVQRAEAFRAAALRQLPIGWVESPGPWPRAVAA
jgi:hypothetical protein